MRNRKFAGAFLIALMMASGFVGMAPLSADTGGPGGPQRSTCAFLQGILWKVGNPEVVGAIFESIFECDLDY
jgi:hypothetical protein